jgi:hypothetical protein
MNGTQEMAGTLTGHAFISIAMDHMSSILCCCNPRSAGCARREVTRCPRRRAVEQAIKRMQRYGEHLERLIAPDGSYAPIGRSLTYRTSVFQPLGLLAWRRRLPRSLSEGQVRAPTLAAQRAIFANPSNFGKDEYLTIGFAGQSPTLRQLHRRPEKAPDETG